MLTKRSDYEKQCNEFTKRRFDLQTKAAKYLKDSPAMEEFQRQINLLDTQEYEFYVEFKKTLKQSDIEITQTINAIAEHQFGPNFNLDEAL